MKRIVKLFTALCLVLGLVFSLCACTESKEYGFSTVSKEDLKVGLICLHDESSTYDNNFITAFKSYLNEFYGSEEEAKKHYEIVVGIPEDKTCYDKATELAKTCNVIFADSFGHESFMMKAASENPTVRFCHATGTKAHTSALANYSNAFADIYEGRYLAGYAAGLKLVNDGKTGDIKIGYVGAFPYAEVVSGYTAFFLGVQAGYSKGNVTMEVKYTMSWYDETGEKEAANTLISNGCVLISQHADSMGAPNACKTAGIPNVTYNVSTQDKCEDTYVAYSRINWAPYFAYMIECTMAGVRIDADWSGNIASGSVEFAISTNPEIWGGTAKMIAAVAQIELVKASIIAGTTDVFSTAKFKDGQGNTLTTYLADVNDFGDYQPETQVIKGGVFQESVYRSAPYFDIRIQGITELTNDAE